MDASRITNTRGTSDGLSPRKRARMDPLERGSRTGYSHVLPSLTTPTPAPAPVPQKLSHSRGITACQTCRNRKTKCDNRRPACGYCAKSGTDCNYIEDNTQTTPCHVFGPQILEAVQHITTLLRQQQQQREHEQNGKYATNISFYTPSSNHTLLDQQSHAFHQDCYDDENGSSAHALQTARRKSHRNRRASSPEGLDSVLKWKIFPKPAPFSTLPASNLPIPPPAQLPSLQHSELARLEGKYIANVHTKNPILDLKKLHGLVSHLAENGPDWSTETCLVSLVCALGAFSQEYSVHEVSGQNRTFDDGARVADDNEEETKLASRYWGIAAKRLGFLVGQNSLEAAQCLCLTGIWYMYNMEPLSAWKYFNLASNSWYLATFERPTYPEQFVHLVEGSQSLTVEQSLYFTCYKSECELTFELSLPGSILEGIDYPHTFPSPPNLDHQALNSNGFEIEQRSWYYYLAEIACRHLINRIIETRCESRLNNTPAGIQRMLKELEVFETQLEEWYTSLPPELTFPIPWDTIEPLADELSNHLRGRYLAIRELCYRPFVRLCATQTLHIKPDLLAQVGAVASHGLLYTMFRIQALRPQSRHHELWFQLRIFNTGSLILIASERAKLDPAMNAAQILDMPIGWREQILETQMILSRYCSDHRGGIWECSQILQWALDGCGDLV